MSESNHKVHSAQLIDNAYAENRGNGALADSHSACVFTERFLRSENAGFRNGVKSLRN